MDRYVSANLNRASLWGGKKKRKKKKKKKRTNGIVQVGGMGGTLQSFCGGGVLANLDFCEVEPWGSEGEGEEWWDRVIRLVEGGREGFWLCVEAEREKADCFFLRGKRTT